MADKKNSGIAVADDNAEKGLLLAPEDDDETKPQPSQETRRAYLGIPVQVRCFCIRRLHNKASPDVSCVIDVHHVCLFRPST